MTLFFHRLSSHEDDEGLKSRVSHFEILRFAQDDEAVLQQEVSGNSSKRRGIIPLAFTFCFLLSAF